MVGRFRPTSHATNVWVIVQLIVSLNEVVLATKIHLKSFAAPLRLPSIFQQKVDFTASRQARVRREDLPSIIVEDLYVLLEE